MNDFSINDNDFLRQFEVEINGKLAKVEYALQERKIFLTKIIIPENTDDNFKEEFLVSIFELIKDRKLRMMPTSSEIKVFLKKTGNIWTYFLLVSDFKFNSLLCNATKIAVYTI